MKHLVKYNNDSIPIIFLWNERVGIIKCLQTDVHTHMHIYNIEYTCHQIIIYVKLILAESVKKNH